MCVRRGNDLSHGWNSGESQGITKPDDEGQIGEEQPAGVTLLRGPGDTGLERPVGAAEAEKALGLHAAWGPCAWRWSRDQRPAPVTENSSRPGRRPPALPLGQTGLAPGSAGLSADRAGPSGAVISDLCGRGRGCNVPRDPNSHPSPGAQERSAAGGHVAPRGDRFTPVPGERTQPSC